MDEHFRGNDEQPTVNSRFICTANHGFAPYAQEELRRLFGSVKSTVLVAGEVLLVTLPDETISAVDQIKAHAPMFLRHLFPVQFQEEGSSVEAALSRLASFVMNRSELQGQILSVQVRKTNDSHWEESAGALKQAIMDKLADAAFDFAVRGADFVLSLFVAKDFWYAGISRADDNLSDWSGGAVRFQKEEGQVSRAKFKLLEAEAAFGIDFTVFRKALDIGAAPGGWTSFLLERGLQVTAVDPARMDSSVLQSPRLTFLRKNAGEVKFRDSEFDVLVCDMSWSPKQMAKLVTGLLYSLARGGSAIVTVKLMHKKPLALIQDVISSFEQAGMQVQQAKQLFHNRDEITLYMIKYS
ncbi:SAM-dependent methyltransferase [Paenibacillus zeirhizosphaerae]|uniref:SAM-dependent methyltransferase n=1 Tax=Paenibacillus zeirhizosphaerae TaxID=2987519 RepID=UPI0035211C7A